MTVYIDPVTHYGATKLRYKYWSHMATDQDDLTELHELAARIGLKREWFQEHATLPHYDVTPPKRLKALECGAVAIGKIAFVQKCSKLFKNKQNNA